ncbi:MAG: gliding motility-associated C-terminal domain-containing protein [Sphingobacteriales bacterium]
MSLTKSFSTILEAAQVKKGMRYMLLLSFFLIAHFYAAAQQFKPKWVDDLRGTSPYCVVTDLAVDKQNNVYVCGWFEGTFDFDSSAGVKNLTSVGQYDTFIAKYKQDGTMVWAESIGSAGVDQPNSIAVDNDGIVSITGISSSPTLDADPGPGVYILNNPTKPLAAFGFLIHLDTNGNFLWAQSGVELYTKVASDSQGNVIATAFFDSPVTIGNSTFTPPPGGFEGLIVKYGSAGNVLWNMSLEAAGKSNDITGCRVDNQDNIIISGDFSSMVNFNPLGTAYNLNPSNTDASFVAKYSPSGTLTWVNGISLVSDVNVGGPSVGVDQQNNIYFSEPYYGLIIFEQDTLKANGIDDNICIAKYSPSGVLQFAKSIGGTDYIDYGSKFAFDKNNNIYLSGYFKGTVNFNTSAVNAKNVSAHGPLDFYVAEYDQNGNYIYAFSGGSPNCGNTFGNGMAIDASNNVDIGGAFCSTVNFDPSGCSPESLSAAASGSDGFIAQYASTAIANDVITAPVVSSFCTSGTSEAIMGSTPSGGTGAYTYQWQSSGDSLNFKNIQGADSINYMPSLLTATTFYRRMVSANCATPLTSNVVALQVLMPLAAPVVTVDSITASSVTFQWTAVTGATAYQVSTDGGQTFNAPSSGATGLTHTVTGLQDGQRVTIIVEAIGIQACQMSAASATGTALNLKNDAIYVPNALTPGGDDRNNQVHVHGENIKSLKFYVYDQWGELLFTSTDTQNGWDGTFKGKKEPVGVYVYYLSAVMNDGQTVNKKGTITLLR